MSEGFARRSPRATEGRRRAEERLGARRAPPVRAGRLARLEAARAGARRPSSRHRGPLRPARAPHATDPTPADRATPDVRGLREGQAAGLSLHREGHLRAAATRKRLPTCVVTPAGFEPAISTLKGSRPWPG